MNKSRNRSYSNGEITLFWRGGECIHATTCYTELRSVFDPLRRPWVNPTGASTAQILQIIEKCPSQALTFRWNEESKNQTESSSKLYQGDVEQNFPREFGPTATVTVRANGPMIIAGDFEMIDTDGSKMRTMQMVSLCRCGKSDSQPYCDGMHFKAGFRG